MEVQSGGLICSGLLGMTALYFLAALTSIHVIYHMLDLKTGISVHSCRSYFFNQTRKHQFNSKNYLEGAAEHLAAVLWWCNFMMEEGEKGADGTYNIAIEWQLKMENITS